MVSHDSSGTTTPRQITNADQAVQSWLPRWIHTWSLDTPKEVSSSPVVLSFAKENWGRLDDDAMGTSWLDGHGRRGLRCALPVGKLDPYACSIGRTRAAGGQAGSPPAVTTAASLFTSMKLGWLLQRQPAHLALDWEIMKSCCCVHLGSVLSSI